MTPAEKMRNWPIPKLFRSYLIPSILGMVLMAINIVVDALMISHGVGADGLAGVNVALPAFSIFFSISLWIGMGGGTLYAMAIGKGEKDQASSIFSSSLVTAVVIVSLLVALALWKIEPLIYFFGANDVIYDYAYDYFFILLVFGMVYVVENILSIFIRNDGNPNLAMFGLIAAALFNIVFDYIFIFIFGWGVKGAAGATILSSVFGLLILLLHFLWKDRSLRWVWPRWNASQLKRILVIGFPSFTTEMTVAVMTIGLNIVFMKTAGDLGVASFAIVNTIHAVVMLIFFGVGGAMQPIASFHHGAGLYERLGHVLKISVRTALLLAVAAVAIGELFPERFALLFDVPNEQLLTMTAYGLPLFFTHYLFLSYNIVYAEYFRAIGEIRRSMMIIVLRGIVFVLPLLWIMPHFFGITGVWLILTIAEALTACIVFLTNRQRPPVPVERR